jgi:CoA-transferase family III
MSFPRDGEIYSENSPANYLYKVIGGTVRTYKTLSNGRRQITALYMAGKLSTYIDLREGSGRRGARSGRRCLRAGLSTGAIAAFGFGAQDVARIRPGIIYVSLCAYGHEGPWASRRGFDSLVQTASGLNAAEAEAFGVREPKPLPAQALDHATGCLMAFAAISALVRRAAQGGSWHVRTSPPRQKSACALARRRPAWPSGARAAPPHSGPGRSRGRTAALLSTICSASVSMSGVRVRSGRSQK